MKPIIIGIVLLSMLCLIMPNIGTSQILSTSRSMTKNTNGLISIVNKGQTLENLENFNEVSVINTDDFGVWVHTKYNGQDDSQKLEIDLVTFKLMLDGGGWRYYPMDFGLGQSTAGIQFSRTQIYVEDEVEPYIDVIQTQFSFETTSDTTENYEVSLEVRFPFSLLEKKANPYPLFENSAINLIKNLRNNFLNNLFEKILKKNNEKTCDSKELNPKGESYFCVRIGFASPQDDKGPSRVETRFFFGRNNIWDPKVFRMKVTPSDLNSEYKLSYFNSYLTVSDTGNEAFSRVFSVDFEPAAELQITYLPGKAKIGYSFGSSAGTNTKISFFAEGGSLSNIVQSFLIDPLPSYMSFDLTILGERSFKYESDSQYSVTYMMDSVEEGELVRIELESLPKTVTAEWGLKVSLGSLTVSGLINLDMSSDLGRASVSLYGSDIPFMEIINFPQKLNISAFFDVTNLKGHIQANKFSSGTTTIDVPIRWDKWEITGSLYINNGFGYASFDLPDLSSNYVSVGLDTNGNSLFGLALSVVDTSLSKEMLSVGVGAVATDDFYVSFDYVGSEIQNFYFSGKITEVNNLEVSVDYSGINLYLTSSWAIGQGGSFELGVNKDLIIDLSNLELGNTKINGAIGLYEGGNIRFEWDRGQIGHFQITTEGISFNPEVELSLYDANSNKIFLAGNLVLNPRGIVKFDWEWGQTGHFTVFTNNFLEELFINVGYNFSLADNEYQYGFKVTATDVNLIRTIQWDTQDGHMPRFWVLGDNPLPGDWDVWLLWNYKWYEVK